MSEIRQTVFFDSCRGVFQGGGCRAAALAGAYRAAKAAGIHFTAVAGTSAGSILAVLIGAGASPEWIVDRISNLKFVDRFLVPPTPQDVAPPLTTRLVGWAAGKVFRKAEISDLVSLGGFYSSKGIEEWVDECLNELLRDKKNKSATFGDLLLPTFVVATDLAEGRERVWGKGLTDGSGVAFAVRASCSIPGFFQPAMEGSTALVDGGLLSNLPAFVYAKADRAFNRRTRGRILAFQLEENFEKPKEWGLKTLALRLADTAVSGATELQVELHGEVHPVRISTGDVKATDFEKMADRTIVETLIRDGEVAVQRFVASEATQLRGDSQALVTSWDQDEIYSAVVYQAEVLPREVMIAQPDTRWYWEIFPTILYWRLRGIPVRVLVEPVRGGDRERKREAIRRANAAALGVDIRETDKIPFAGYLFTSEDPYSLAAIVHAPESTYGPKAKIYRGLSHEPAIDSLRTRMEKELAGAPAPAVSTLPVHTPKLVAFDKEKLIVMLQNGVGQYGRARISIESVRTAHIRPITRLIRAYKYRQAIRLARDFEAAGLSFFGSAAVTLADGRLSVMGPPVIEIHGNDNIGVEGNSRTYYCYLKDIPELECVVVRGVTAGLPGTSVDLKEVNVIDSYLPPAERMPGFRYEDFRRIEGAVHPLDPS